MKEEDIGEEFVTAPIEEEIIKEETKEGKEELPSLLYPDEVYIIPLNRRPFFPGMAAPILIEKGSYYEALKLTVKTDHKCMGLFLTKKENSNIYKIGLSDLYEVGVLARILRIVPIEKGGAQVVLNMEKRISIKEQSKNKYLCATCGCQ